MTSSEPQASNVFDFLFSILLFAIFLSSIAVISILLGSFLYF